VDLQHERPPGRVLPRAGRRELPGLDDRPGILLQRRRAWIRERLNDVFLRRGLRGKIESRIRVEEFTQPGDPFRFDYAYRYNGTRGYVHTVALDRDAAQAKVLAYTRNAFARAPRIPSSQR